MADRSHGPGFKVFLSLGALLLILFACVVQYYSFPSGSGTITDKGHVFQSTLESAVGKVALPFGKQDLLRPLFNPKTVKITSNVPQQIYPPKHPYRLHKRQDSPWADALTTGRTFLNKLSGASGPRQQTQWSAVNDLKEHGWTVPNPVPDTMEYYPDAFRTLGIDGSEAYSVAADQGNRSSNCYHSDLDGTGAEYVQTYNAPGRTIISTHNFSPMYTLRRYNPIEAQDPAWIATHLPEVRTWSDVVGAIWAELAGSQAYTLKYVFKHGVITDETREIMEKAALQTTAQYAPFDPDSYPVHPLTALWPGVEFRKGSEGYQALLGTPHGKGVVWLIVNHPHEMPGKDIESVTAFVTKKSDFTEYHLLFTLTD